MFRLFAFTLAALVVTSFTVASAAKPKGDSPHGVVVSAGAGKITVKMKMEEKSYDLTTDAMVTIKGAAGKIEDVKAGDHVKLTMTGDKVSAVAVEEPKPKK